jgi:hypothetical protein
MNPTLKSIGAVLAGIIAGAALPTVTDMLLRATGIFPPFNLNEPVSNTLLLLATAYRTVYGVLVRTSRPGSHQTGQWATRWSLAPSASL